MYKFLLGFLFLFLFHFCDITAQNSLAEKLGFSEDDKLLIIHADDLAMAHSQNLGAFLSMQAGMVNSASIMMPCPWVKEVVDFKKDFPESDLGLHLTLTSEWKYMRYGPVASKDKVPSLLDEDGFLRKDCLVFGQNAKPAEAEIELRAQIDLAIQLGLKPTHMDTHMGCLVFSSPEMFGIYLKVGRDYKIPVMVDRFFLQAVPESFKKMITDRDVIIDRSFTAIPPDFENGMDKYYEDLLNNLPAGVNVLNIHPAFNNAEMQALTIDHPDWGAEWRQADFDFFTSANCKSIIEKQNIKLITWGMIQTAFYQ